MTDTEQLVWSFHDWIVEVISKAVVVVVASMMATAINTQSLTNLRISADEAKWRISSGREIGTNDSHYVGSKDVQRPFYAS